MRKPFFTALLAAAALSLSASTGGAAPTGHTAASCAFAQYKITNRVMVSCRVAKKVVKSYFGSTEGTYRNWTCKAASDFRSGSCKKNAARFKFKA